MKNDLASYDKEREILISLSLDDQKDLKKLTKDLSKIVEYDSKLERIKQTAYRCHHRAERMIEILDTIRGPVLSILGYQSSEIVILLSLHSYLDIMNKVISIFEAESSTNKNNLPMDYLPTLIDRVSIVESKKQIFGTTWYSDQTGRNFIIPIKNLSRVNNIRMNYGLDILRDLSKSNTAITSKNIKEYEKEISNLEFNLNFAFMEHRLE